MRNRIGPIATGKDYYPRPNLTRRFWRRIEAGENLYLNAPRRSGKTSFMYQIKENPLEGYECAYLNTEAISDADNFFKNVLKELLACASLNKKELAHKSKSVFTQVFERFKSIEVAGLKLEMNNPEAPSSYVQILHDLISKLDPKEVRIILLIDEFPTTVANIIKKHGDEAGIRFLQENRSIRQSSSQAVQIVCTGSIGLPALVGKLKATATVNDFNLFDIPPFTKEEATDLVTKLLKSAKILYDEKVMIPAILHEVNWLMPFFLQLVVGQLIDIFDDKGVALTASDVRVAVEHSSSLRSNFHFQSYYDRIETAFSQEEADMAKHILRRIAEKNTVSETDMFKDTPESSKSMQRTILEALELDGYIGRIEGGYRFNSPILQRWWLKYDV